MRRTARDDGSAQAEPIDAIDAVGASESREGDDVERTGRYRLQGQRRETVKLVAQRPLALNAPAVHPSTPGMPRAARSAAASTSGVVVRRRSGESAATNPGPSAVAGVAVSPPPSSKAGPSSGTPRSSRRSQVSGEVEPQIGPVRTATLKMAAVTPGEGGDARSSGRMFDDLDFLDGDSIELELKALPAGHVAMETMAGGRLSDNVRFASQPKHAPVSRPSRELLAAPASRPSRELLAAPTSRPSRELLAAPTSRPSREMLAAPTSRSSREMLAAPMSRSSREMLAAPTSRSSRELLAAPASHGARNFPQPTSSPDEEVTTMVRHVASVVSGPSVSARRPGIVAFAGFGIVPTKLSDFPAYALRVFARRRVLRAGLAAARGQRPQDVELYELALETVNQAALAKGMALIVAVVFGGIACVIAAIVYAL